MSEGSETITFSGTVTEDGRVKPDQVNATRGRLARWGGRKVTVSVRRYVKNKTNEQLALYFGPVMDAWVDFTGYTHDEMDTELRRAYLAPQLAISRLTGEEILERPRVRDLSVEEMSVYIDRVIREGTLKGIEFALNISSARI